LDFRLDIVLGILAVLIEQLIDWFWVDRLVLVAKEKRAQLA
jgi:hypothetical protein